MPIRQNYLSGIHAIVANIISVRGRRDRTRWRSGFGQPRACAGPQRYAIITLCLMLPLWLAACSGASTQVASATVVEALSFGDEQAFARPTQPMAFVFPR
ncbi:MAG: hypothetical protein KDE47_17785, partial [Caldilineaceae bacterium]|nr:hypothetical protein [Caldilineaceae bacterium]